MTLNKIKKEMLDDQFLHEEPNAKDVVNSAIAQMVEISKQIYVNARLGSDRRNGSLQFPYKSIQHALNKAIAGDTINVMSGTYNERVEFTKSGTETNPITLRNCFGHCPIIDGTGLEWGDSSTGALIQFNRHSHLVIEGLSVQNSAAFGIGDLAPFPATKNMRNIKIRNCSTMSTFGCGIHIQKAYDIEIANCTIVDACANTWDECISLNDVNGFEIKDCHVSDSFKEGIDAKEGSRNGKIHGCTVRNVHSVGIYIDAYSGHQYNIEVFNNTISDMLGSGISTGAENGGKLESVVIRNNTIFACNRGINIAAFNEEAGTPYVLKDIIVRNNVTFDVLYSGVFIPSKVENILIENNILFTGEGAEGYGVHVYDTAVTDLSELTIRNNFFRESWGGVEEPIGIDAKVLLDLEGSTSAYGTVFKDATGMKTGTRDFSLAYVSHARGAGYKGQDMGSQFQGVEGTSATTQIELFKNNKELPMISSVLPNANTFYRRKTIFIQGGAGIADGVFVCLKQSDKNSVAASVTAAEVIWSFLDIILTSILVPIVIAILLLSHKVKALTTDFFTSDQYYKIGKKEKSEKKASKVDSET